MVDTVIKLHFVDILLILLDFLSMLVPLLIMIAIATLFERKVMGAMQRRKGPNVVGIFGILQPIADGVKLLLKEIIVPKKANIWLFFLAPLITFILSLWHWVVIPFSVSFQLININLSILYTLAISSLSVYGLIIAGWASNSKYAFLGAMRSAAQVISYEVSIGIIIMILLINVGSFNLTDIVESQYYI